MSKKPIVLISPNVEKKGDEFGDVSTSVSETYQRALLDSGAIPLALPATNERQVIAQAVSQADGVLLTGGEDVDPRIFMDPVPATKAARTVKVTEDGGARDHRELMLVDEVFRQRKALLAICRGHQVLNVALGGTLILDIKLEVPRALPHRQMEKRSQVVHEVRLTADCELAKITGRHNLGVNSTHHQAVGAVAEPLRPVALSRDGVVEGMELRPELAGMLPFLLSVQFHPERLAPKHREHAAIFRRFTARCLDSRKRKL